MIFLFCSSKKLKLDIYEQKPLPEFEFDLDLFMDQESSVIDQQPTQKTQDPVAPPPSPRTEIWGEKSNENTDNNTEEDCDQQDPLSQLVEELGIKVNTEISRQDSGFESADEDEGVTDENDFTDENDVEDENNFSEDINVLQLPINNEEIKIPIPTMELIAPPDNGKKKRKSKTYQTKREGKHFIFEIISRQIESGFCYFV